MVWEEIYVYAPKVLRVLAVSAESSRRCMFSVPDTKAHRLILLFYIAFGVSPTLNRAA